MARDRPVSGRIFVEQLIRENLDIGRPDKVNIVFGPTIRQRGKFPAPGTFRTQAITNGACPYLSLFYKKTQVKQYLQGRTGAPRRDHLPPAPQSAHVRANVCKVAPEVHRLASRVSWTWSAA